MIIKCRYVYQFDMCEVTYNVKIKFLYKLNDCGSAMQI